MKTEAVWEASHFPMWLISCLPRIAQKDCQIVPLLTLPTFWARYKFALMEYLILATCNLLFAQDNSQWRMRFRPEHAGEPI